MSKESERIISEEESINYFLSNTKLNAEDRLQCRILFQLYKQGISYRGFDALMKDMNLSYRAQNMENQFLEKMSYNHLSFFTTKCPECKSFQRGNKVFCSKCLAGGKKKRRLTGCRGRHCYANPNFISDDCIDKEDIATLKEKVCNHKRVTGNKIYSFTPVMHIIILINNGLDDLLISTREQIQNHIQKCVDNGSYSGIMCYNSIPCFTALGEEAIANSIANAFSKIESMENNTKCIINFLKQITNPDSLENNFY